MITALTIVLTIGAGLVSASFFEWTVHKYFMHRPVRFVTRWFVSHTRVHHVKFGYDESYHIQNEGDKGIIGMILWAPLLILAGFIPYLPVLLVSHMFDLGQTTTVFWTGLAVSVLYYAAYEYHHHVMHYPKDRWVERTQLFRRMNGHHLIHHRHMGKNFNVVLPLADWCMNTLLLRATVKFKQPLGPAVPDVQPKQ